MDDENVFLHGRRMNTLASCGVFYYKSLFVLITNDRSVVIKEVPFRIKTSIAHPIENPPRRTSERFVEF